MKNIKDFKMYLESLGSTDSVRLNEIINLIEDNITEGWKGEELEESIECVILEDVDNTELGEGYELKYNGWYESLLELSKDDQNINNLIQLINDSKEDLWTNDLEETFQCVIIADIDVSDYNKEYNGWYQDLINLS